MPTTATVSALRPTPKPLPYSQIKQFLKQGLRRGRWLPGALMPSEAELVSRFGVSRMTVGRAIRELQSEGLVNRVQGSGTYAATLHKVSATLQIQDLQEEIAARGGTYCAQVHLAREERVTAALATKIGLPLGSRIFHTQIVHFENSVALQFEDRFVNPLAAPDYLTIDFSLTSPTHYLLAVAPLWEAQYSIEARTPTELEARLLAIDPTESCLVLSRRTANRQVPITFAQLVHAGSRYQIEGQYKP
jgi:GntR family transcriptional regulator, histidine utilization repressor